MAVNITSISHSDPYLKEEVVLMGTGFGSQGNNTVTIDGTVCTIYSDSETRVSFFIPSTLTEGQTYTVTLTNTTDNTSDTVSVTIKSEPPDDVKDYIAIFFGKYTSGTYHTDKSGIPYTDKYGSPQTNGSTPTILFNICNPDITTHGTTVTIPCQPSQAAGPYGHTKILEGLSGERDVTYDDFRWASANSDITTEQSKWVYTIPTLSPTISSTSFAPGDKVSISGDGVTPESTITINGTSITIDKYSLEYLEFTVPTLRKGFYTLIYTNIVGSSRSFSVEVTEKGAGKPLKTIPIVAGLTGSISKIKIVQVSPNNDVSIEVDCKGDLQIETKVYLKLTITKPDGSTWSITTSKVDIGANKTHTFSITFPASGTSLVGTYTADFEMWSELWVGSETTPRETEKVDTQTRDFLVSDQPTILRQETIDELPTRLTLGLEADFTIWTQNFASSSHTLWTRLRIIHENLVSTSPCSVRSGGTYDYFQIDSGKKTVSAGKKQDFLISWTPPRETILGDYYICVDLYCDTCT